MQHRQREKTETGRRAEIGHENPSADTAQRIKFSGLGPGSCYDEQRDVRTDMSLTGRSRLREKRDPTGVIILFEAGDVGNAMKLSESGV